MRLRAYETWQPGRIRDSFALAPSGITLHGQVLLRVLWTAWSSVAAQLDPTRISLRSDLPCSYSNASSLDCRCIHNGQLQCAGLNVCSSIKAWHVIDGEHG